VSATFDQTNKVYSTRAYACKGSQDGESQKYVIGRGNLEIFASTDNAKEVETAYEHALKKVQASNRDSIGEDVVEPEKLFWVLPDTNSMGRTTSRDAVRLSNTSDFRHQHAHIAPHYEVDDVSLDADSASHLVNWEQNTDTGNSAPPVTVDISAYTTHPGAGCEVQHHGHQTKDYWACLHRHEKVSCQLGGAVLPHHLGVQSHGRHREEG